MSLPVIVSAAASVIAVWAVSSYNFLVHARAKVRKARRGVHAQLKHRHDLVPRLNEVMRAHAGKDHEAIRAAAAQRSRAIKAKGTRAIEDEENGLAAELSKLLAVAEEYPGLKGDAKFDKLSAVLAALEHEIQAACALYNASAEHYNANARRFPTSLIATWLSPKSFRCLRFDPVEFDHVPTRVGEFAA